MKKSMNSEKILQAIILSVALVLMAAILNISLGNYFKEKIRIEEKRVFNEAVDGCSHTSKYIYENAQEGVITEEPIKGHYEECMRKKGY